MPTDDSHAAAGLETPHRAVSVRRAAMSFADALPASLRGVFAAPDQTGGLPPELAFLVAEGITPGGLDEAAKAAAAAGVTGEAALLGLGLSDDLYYRLLARHLGVPYLERPLPLAAGGFDFVAASGVGEATLAPNPRGLRRLHAPRGEALRLLLRRHHFACRGRYGFALTTPRRLDALLRHHEGAGFIDRAADGLANWDASLSARGGALRWQKNAALLLATVAGFGCGAAPAGVCFAFSLLLFALFAAAVAQRLVVVAASPEPGGPPPPGLSDRDLPVYTVLVPLFREALVLPQLVRALDALDYPPSKLDIKILLEACDRETIAAAARLRLPHRYDVMVLDERHPRTKPRALNAGLDCAKGSCVVVYDAEDRPDPGQLRAAASRFAEAPAGLACLQARLAIDHADETWVTRMFALEYAALFGVVKPGLAALGLPIPLGGTSNHFRGIMEHRQEGLVNRLRAFARFPRGTDASVRGHVFGKTSLLSARLAVLPGQGKDIAPLRGMAHAAGPPLFDNRRHRHLS